MAEYEAMAEFKPMTERLLPDLPDINTSKQKL